MSTLSSNVALNDPGGVERAFLICPLMPDTVRRAAPSNLATSNWELNIPCEIHVLMTNDIKSILVLFFSAIALFFLCNINNKPWWKRSSWRLSREFRLVSASWPPDTDNYWLYRNHLPSTVLSPGYRTWLALSTLRTTPVAAMRKPFCNIVFVEMTAPTHFHSCHIFHCVCLFRNRRPPPHTHRSLVDTLDGAESRVLGGDRTPEMTVTVHVLRSVLEEAMTHVVVLRGRERITVGKRR